jgi:gliding motility-associated-like protein
MKKQILFLSILFLLPFTRSGGLHAQSFSLEVIGSEGTFLTSANGSISWTIGEVVTDTYFSTTNILTQGFHQPESVKNVVSESLFIPEGFSPNGDEINDLFVIRGLDMYPHNSIVIFNRWGNEIFSASPYKNTWDGTSTGGLRIGGDELPVATYFYLLNLGDGSDVIKGTIYLNK